MFTQEQIARINQWSTVLGLDIKGVRSIFGVRPYSLQARISRELGFKSRFSDDYGTLYLFEEKFVSGSIQDIDNVIFHQALYAGGFKGLLGDAYPTFCGLVCENLPAFAVRSASKALGINLSVHRKPSDTVAVAEELMRRCARYEIKHDSTDGSFALLFREAMKILRTRLPINAGGLSEPRNYLPAFLRYENRMSEERMLASAGGDDAEHLSSAALKTIADVRENGVGDRDICLGRTSSRLQTAGIDDCPLLITDRTMKIKSDKHDISLGKLINRGLIERLQNPLAVFSSRNALAQDENARRYMILTDMPCRNEQSELPSNLVAIVACRDRKDGIRNAEVISLYAKPNYNIARRLFETTNVKLAERQVLYADDRFFDEYIPEALKPDPKIVEKENRKRDERMGIKTKRPRISSGTNCLNADPRSIENVTKIVTFLKFQQRDKKKSEKSAVSFSVIPEEVFEFTPVKKETGVRVAEKTPEKRDINGVLKASDFKSERTFRFLYDSGVRTVRDLMTKETVVCERLSAAAQRDVRSFLEPFRRTTREHREDGFSYEDCRRIAERAFPTETVRDLLGDINGVCVVLTADGMNAVNLRTGKPLLGKAVESFCIPREGWSLFQYLTPEGKLKYNFVNSRGEFISRDPFDRAEHFNGGKARVWRGDVRFDIDRTGRVTERKVASRRKGQSEELSNKPLGKTPGKN